MDIQTVQELINQKAKEKVNEIINDFLKAIEGNRFAKLLKADNDKLYYLVSQSKGGFFQCSLNLFQAKEELTKQITGEETEKFVARLNGLFD